MEVDESIMQGLADNRIVPKLRVSEAGGRQPFFVDNLWTDRSYSNYSGKGSEGKSTD